MKNFTVTYVVSSESSEKLRHARQLAAGKASLDSLCTEVATAKDRIITSDHRIGDYFSAVQVADNGPSSFRLVFVPIPNADRYWKDLVVTILKSIREIGVSIKSEK